MYGTNGRKRVTLARTSIKSRPAKTPEDVNLDFASARRLMRHFVSDSPLDKGWRIDSVIDIELASTDETNGGWVATAECTPTFIQRPQADSNGRYPSVLSADELFAAPELLAKLMGRNDSDHDLVWDSLSVLDATDLTGHNKQLSRLIAALVPHAKMDLVLHADKPKRAVMAKAFRRLARVIETERQAQRQAARARLAERHPHLAETFAQLDQLP